LELHTFLDRLEGCLDQLVRADLPGAGMLIEAVGLSEHEPSLATAGWDTTISLVQACVRGIDVVSEFRPFTLCVFLPGCSQDAAMERAAKIQANLNTASQTWQSGACPERLAISISQIESTDSTALFLNRLESALDDAIDAAPNEVVIPDGESSLFQKVSD
ncbi:MAG: hypothetical protein KDB22_30185, partial [Planctomycetales bacterium]|nr:hypothetical protein [Planctomycetales bacterium]